MTVLPVDPSIAGLGAEWQIAPVGAGGIESVEAPAGSESFGDLLGQQISNLTELQETASAASQSLADGTATDISSVVVAVEKAQLAMQLAGQIRTRASEAISDMFRTQI